MFRALLCSSSGGENCIVQHLVSSHCVGGRLPPTQCDDDDDNNNNNNNNNRIV